MNTLKKLLLTLPAFLVATSAHAWWSDEDNGGSMEPQPIEESANVNVPDDMQKQVQEHFHKNSPEIDSTAPTLVALREQGERIQEGIIEAYEDNRELFDGRNPSYDQEEVDREIREVIELTQAQFGYTDDDDCKKPGRLRTFSPIQSNSFETSTNLASIAQEPIFLENKEEFSFEIRPFLGGKNYDHCFQFGTVLTARKQWDDKYISGQILSARTIFVHENSRDIIAALTYGHFFNDQFAGSITLSSGWTTSRIHLVIGKSSHPKAWSLGLSPMLVYYMPIKIPLDLFLGGDVYYSHKPSYEGYDLFGRCHFEAENDVLWRVKFGPSYTMKSEGRYRLYQLKFSLAANVQSETPDRITAAPSILFESQGHQSRGGYLFNLGFNLGSQKKSWQFAYGLRF